MRACGPGTAAAAALLAVAVGCAVRPVVPPPPAPVATPTAVPTSTPAPTPTSTPAAVPEREDARPPVVRVLLQGGSEPLFPEPGRRYACVAAGAVTVLRGPLVANAAGGRAEIQVGAFAMAANAAGMVGRLAAAGFEGRADGAGEAARRVVAVGREGEDADALAARLARAGFADQKRVAARLGGTLTVTGEGGASVAGATVRVVPLDAVPTSVGGKAVRGEFELLAGERGVAVVNVVNLEEYLRGVVPAEMGPRAFPSLEALKAQAVAARTYAAAHLGDHAAEGYDLCDSQACQVYEGAGAESALSDRAVRETADEVATWQGRPIDAMYHSTCGGHTEDAAALFPDRAQPYLMGVRCAGEATVAVGVPDAAGPWVGPLDRLVNVGEALARALGGGRSARGLTARLTGADPGSGSDALVRAFGLAGAGAALHVAPGAGEDGAMELLRTFRLPLPPPRAGARATWEIALAVRLAQLAGKVQAIAGRLVPGPAGARLIPDGGEPPRDLGRGLEVLVRKGERWRRAAVAAMAGSPATLWCAGGVCPVVEVEPLDAADGASVWTWWVRELPLDEIGRRLGLAGVREVAVVRRGVSGRAVEVAVGAAAGVKRLPAIPFRRALDLPDTLFVVVPAGTTAHPSLRFLGRGWGHGVGMCQNGAYGLARAGETYVEILKTYYSGIEVQRREGGRP